MKFEPFRTLTVDPGEDTGWSVWRMNDPVGSGGILLGAHTTKLWEFADLVYEALDHNDPDALLNQRKSFWTRDGMEDHNEGPIGRIVCEDFRIYPWEAKNLAWDQVRTARLIGALTWFAHHFDIPLQLQGANTKERAVAGGAEELFYRPLHENRHQNDAIMHGTYFSQIGPT